MILNAVVIVGDRFAPDMVSPEHLFDLPVDVGRLLLGPISQVNYGSGRCGFTLNPSRIDLRVQSQEVMPQELRSATERLAAILEGIRVAVDIGGIGFNCDCVFPATGKTGRDISNGLAQVDQLVGIVGVSPVQAKTAFNYSLENVRYTLRIEPHVASDGRDLFVAVNGHQDVDKSSSLISKLEAFDPFHKHVRSIHDHIRRTLL